MSGPFAKALMAAGWTPNAAVTARLAGGALVMALFATLIQAAAGYVKPSATPRPWSSTA